MTAAGPRHAFSSSIHVIRARPPELDNPVEVIERKGLGHPDTICDALACAISRAYSRYCLDQCEGFILHHQFDKIMLVGGKAEVAFGEPGRFLEPIRIQVAGRASTRFRRHEIPVRQIVHDVVTTYMTTHFLLPDPDRDLVIEHLWTSSPGPGTIRGSTGPIAEMFHPSSPEFIRGYGAHFVANDTSFCVGYAPLSPLEQSLITLETSLSGPELRRLHPWLGSDIKIMGVRVGSEIEITLCVPQIARFVSGLDEYRRNLETMRSLVRERLCPLDPLGAARIHLNTKDDFAEKNLYLTITGASLSGDIGVVGRGNRPNGLITASRPMSLEGASGKNPRYYSGIVYNLAARHLADSLFERLHLPNVVRIVSQNGAPLLDPWKVIVTIDAADENPVVRLVRDGLAQIPALTREFINGRLSLY